MDQKQFESLVEGVADEFKTMGDFLLHLLDDAQEDHDHISKLVALRSMFGCVSGHLYTDIKQIIEYIRKNAQ